MQLPIRPASFHAFDWPLYYSWGPEFIEYQIIMFGERWTSGRHTLRILDNINKASSSACFIQMNFRHVWPSWINKDRLSTMVFDFRVFYCQDKSKIFQLGLEDVLLSILIAEVQLPSINVVVPDNGTTLKIELRYIIII
jgi:hypothetical protein